MREEYQEKEVKKVVFELFSACPRLVVLRRLDPVVDHIGRLSEPVGCSPTMLEASRQRWTTFRQETHQKSCLHLANLNNKKLCNSELSAISMGHARICRLCHSVPHHHRRTCSGNCISQRDIRTRITRHVRPSSLSLLQSSAVQFRMSVLLLISSVLRWPKVVPTDSPWREGHERVSRAVSFLSSGLRHCGH